MSGRERLLDLATAALRNHPGDEAELVIQTGRRDLSRCANSVIHQNVSSENAVMTARVIQGGRIGTASVHGLSAETAAAVLKDAAELARFAPRDETFPGLPDPASYPEVASHVEATAALTPADRARALGAVFDTAGKHDLIVAGAFGTAVEELAVANTRGVAAYAPLTSAAVNLVVSGDTSSGFAAGASRDVRTLDVPAMADRAVRKCLEGTRPVEVEPGEYEVILEPPAVAEILEWMTFTCFSARSMKEKTSALAGNLGKSIMGDNVTLVDDATRAGGIPTPFDFEGSPKQRLALIEHGVARGFGIDRQWAGRLGLQSTGHGMPRRGEEGDPIPINLFLEPGETPAADLVAGVKHGLLVTRFHYVNGFLDTRRALMTGMTRDGTFLIRDGKVQGAVGNLRFTQSMVEAFRDVRALSREAQTIPTWWSDAANTGAFTVPSVHLGRFHFTGRTEK